MGPIDLNESEPQKKSSDASKSGRVPAHFGYLDPPQVEPSSFDLAIAQFPDAGNARPRAPLESDGVQLNFCKSPTCKNFGIPVEQTSTKGAQSHKNPNLYAIVSSGKGLPMWTAVDYANSVKASGRKNPGDGKLESAIADRYAKAAKRDDAEATDAPTPDDQLPDRGMQVHTEYLLYGAFLRMREMLDSTEKVRFFLDQDSGMRAACLGAWADRVQDRTCDAFYVTIAKERTVDQKRNLIAAAHEEIAAAMAALNCTKQEAVLAVLRYRITAARTFGKWNDRWVFHPVVTMSEPEKALCHLTDYGDMDEDHLAWLYNKASLHGVDSYFNRIRRRLSLLERGIHSQANAGRVWNGYAPYNPEQIQKLLDIFRVCHNYMWTRKVWEKSPIDPDTGEQSSELIQVKKTPAMLLGLAKGVVSFEDVIYFSTNFVPK